VTAELHLHAEAADGSAGNRALARQVFLPEGHPGTYVPAVVVGGRASVCGEANRVQVNLAAGSVFEKDGRVGLDAARISRAEVLGPELLQAVPVGFEKCSRSDDVVEQYQVARRTPAVRAFSLAARPRERPASLVRAKRRCPSRHRPRPGSPLLRAAR